MALNLIDPDALFFTQHRDRYAHIRDAIGEENNAEFLSLGSHDKTRRRIIICRVPNNAKMAAGKLMKLPMLAFADESIEDTDEVLLPLIDELMKGAAKRYNIHVPKERR